MLGRPAMLGAGLEERDGRVVVDRLGVHRLDDARCRRRSSAVCGSSSLSQAPHWPCWANLNIDGDAREASSGREVMPVSRWPMRTESGSSWPCMLAQLRLVVEQVDLRRAARQEQVDHPLGLGGEVQRRQRAMRAAASAVQERRQRQRRSSRRSAKSTPCRCRWRRIGPTEVRRARNSRREVSVLFARDAASAIPCRASDVNLW